jgi:hypothetical protein
MEINKVFRTLLENKNIVAKRRKWKNKIIKVYEIGYANKYGEPEKPTERTLENADKFFMQLITDNRIIGEYTPSLSDTFMNDWEIISE